MGSWARRCRGFWIGCNTGPNLYLNLEARTPTQRDQARAQIEAILASS